MIVTLTIILLAILILIALKFISNSASSQTDNENTAIDDNESLSLIELITSYPVEDPIEQTQPIKIKRKYNKKKSVKKMNTSKQK